MDENHTKTETIRLLKDIKYFVHVIGGILIVWWVFWVVFTAIEAGSRRDNWNTGQPIAPIEEKERSAPWIGTFKVTAYCACKKCTAPYDDGLTATGVSAKGNIIAVDPDVIPLHSVVEVESLGIFMAEDIGGRIKGNRADILMPTHQEAKNFGVQWRRVRKL